METQTQKRSSATKQEHGMRESIHPGIIVPPVPKGRTFLEVVGETLATHLPYRFRNFSGLSGIVADIGCNDGRYVPALRMLGADEVYGIDPSQDFLDNAIAAGKLDPRHTICSRVEDLPSAYDNFFDYTIVLGSQIRHEREAINSLSSITKSTGGVLATFFTREELEIALQHYPTMFKTTETQAILCYTPSQTGPHAFGIYCTKS